MTTHESLNLRPPILEDDEAHALAEEAAERERLDPLNVEQTFDEISSELLAAAQAPAPAPAPAEKPRTAFQEVAEYDDNLHAEKMERESKSRLKRFMGSKVMRFFTERDPETGGFTYGDGALANAMSRKKSSVETTESPADIDEEFADEALTEEIPVVTERESVRDRIRSRITRGKEAMKRKFSRQPEYKLQRLLDKNDKAEAKRVKMMAKADALQDMLDADEEAALQAEAAHQAMIDDAHDEANEMDKMYETVSEAYDMNDEFDEAKRQEEREATLQAERDKIAKQIEEKNDEILRKALAKMDKNTQKGFDKQDKVTDEKIRLKGIRGRAAQALLTINR